jgi:enoyl-CoA hydratase
MFIEAADLVVAADEAVFSSPVMERLSANDVEIPGAAWMLGSRRAKQALWMSERISATEALELGMVNWVVPEADLDAHIDSVLERVLRIPAETLALSKESFRFMEERRGLKDFSDYHFMNHLLSHYTTDAVAAQEGRAARIRSGQAPVATDD